MVGELPFNFKFFWQLRPFLVTLEGNLGSGKSTLLNRLKTWPMAECREEPVQTWTQFSSDENMLELAYKQPKQYSFHFQILVALTQRYDQSKKPLLICERSLISQWLFCANHFKSKNITSMELNLLRRLIARLLATQTPNLIIYLRTPPSLAFERIRQRNRAEEKNISFEYIKALHELHEKIFVPSEFVIVIEAAHRLSERQLDELQQYICQRSYQYLQKMFQK